MKEKKILYIITGIITGISLVGTIGVFASGNIDNNLISNNSKSSQQEIEDSNDENLMETQDDNIKLPSNSISEIQAKNIISKSYPGNEILGVETENENGKIVYNISLKDGTDVKVDVLNGNIVNVDKRISERENKD